jgi:hypothetical protein
VPPIDDNSDSSENECDKGYPSDDEHNDCDNLKYEHDDQNTDGDTDEDIGEEDEDLPARACRRHVIDLGAGTILHLRPRHARRDVLTIRQKPAAELLGTKFALRACHSLHTYTTSGCCQWPGGSAESGCCVASSHVVPWFSCTKELYPGAALCIFRRAHCIIQAVKPSTVGGEMNAYDAVFDWEAQQLSMTGVGSRRTAAYAGSARQWYAPVVAISAKTWLTTMEFRALEGASHWSAPRNPNTRHV